MAPISTAVTHTSPSPWAKCPSPTENSAPLNGDWQQEFGTLGELFDIKVPTVFAWRQGA